MFLCQMYKHIFFDLDHTLWDHESNSEQSLRELYQKHKLKEKGIEDLNIFLKTYQKINHEFWDAYSAGQISKEVLRNERFFCLLASFGIRDRVFAQNFSTDYIQTCSQKKQLMPHAMDVLDYLKPKYKLHIITNGFEETQFSKLAACGIRDYFEAIVIADAVGFKKPDPKIFEIALNQAKAKKEESIYIGDNPQADIQGAMNAGWKQILYNSTGIDHDLKPSFEIETLLQLKALF